MTARSPGNNKQPLYVVHNVRVCVGVNIISHTISDGICGLLGIGHQLCHCLDDPGFPRVPVSQYILQNHTQLST